MNNILSSFYTKLSIALLASFLVIGVAVLVFVMQLTKDHQNEVEQKLHLNLAEHIVHDGSLLKNGKIDKVALKHAFHSMMILGPSFEFYLLEPDGSISTYSADPEKIKRESVALSPITSFLSGDVMLPLLGDDPRSVSRQKIFSVAEIRDGSILKGYLYIIIGGEIYDSVADIFKQSHIFKLSIFGLAAAMVFGLVMLLLLFGFLTKPLRQLSKDMQQFRDQGFERGEIPDSTWQADSHDEIQRLGVSFKEMAGELQGQYQKIKNIDNLRREMISYVSHDIRTPLASLQGYLETWQIKQETISDEEGRALIDVAMKNAGQVSKLVEQLFELAHLDGDDVKLHKEPVAVAELVFDVFQKLNLDAQEKQITLDVQPQDSSLLVYADIEKLERVLTNLIDNAIRHCDVSDKITVELKSNNNKIEISVKDSGAGIHAEDLPHIFDPHFRAVNSAQGKGVNSGLGLAITKRILNLHGEDISVQSELSQGSEFTFSLTEA